MARVAAGRAMRGGGPRAAATATTAGRGPEAAPAYYTTPIFYVNAGRSALAWPACRCVCVRARA
jgi:hypothetical protein